jgi:hypothetical protein
LKEHGNANNISMDQKRMLFCVLHHPMNAEPHNIPPGDRIKEEGFSLGNREIDV